MKKNRKKNMKSELGFSLALISLFLVGCVYHPPHHHTSKRSTTTYKKSAPTVVRRAPDSSVIVKHRPDYDPEYRTTDESYGSVNPPIVGEKQYPGQERKLPRQSAATANLLALAEKKIVDEDYVSASAQVERALRMSPKSPFAYHKLAEIRFKQKRYAAAEQLAKKALSFLPRGNFNALTQRRELWLLIASARRSSGDVSGAQQATETARSL